MKGFLLLLFLLVLGLFACSKKVKSAKEIATPTPEEKATTFANKTYQKDFQIDFNNSKTVACISKSVKKQTEDTHPTLSFTLYETDSEKILFKETIRRATGKWISDNQFEVTTVPERVGRMGTLNKKEGWVYDISTLKKMRK